MKNMKKDVFQKPSTVAPKAPIKPGSPEAKARSREIAEAIVKNLNKRVLQEK